MSLKALVYSLPIFFIFFFFYYPLLNVFKDAFFVGSNFTLDNFLGIISNKLNQKVILFTLYQAFLSMLLTIILGLPLSFLISKYDFKGKEFIRALILVPFILPPIVVAHGFILFFGRDGLLNRILLGISLVEKPMDFEGIMLILLAHSFYNIPLVVQMVSSSLERIPEEVEEAAESLGTPPLRKFFRITLPYIRNSILSSALLTFIFCLLSFTIVLSLGGVKYMTVEVQIYSLYKFLFSPERASGLAIIQILTAAVASYTYLRLQGDEKYRRAILGLHKREKVKISFKNVMNVKGILILTYLILITILLSGPIFSVIYYSFFDIVSGEFSLSGYERIFTGEFSEYLGTSPISSIVNTIFFASLSLFLSITLGTIAAYSISRANCSGKNLYNLLILIPIGTSSMSLALGLIRTYGDFPILKENSWVFIVLSHTILGLPFVTRSILNSLERIDRNLIDASDSLGSSRFDTFFTVELPLIYPSFVTGSVFSFAMSIGEMSMALFFSSPRTMTMTVSMYRYMGVRKYLEASAMGSILILISTLSFVIIRKIGRWAFLEEGKI
ncbi:MAG: ABC transporter permease [Candidatus Asgardarchaeia archaeon]